MAFRYLFVTEQRIPRQELPNRLETNAGKRKSTLTWQPKAGAFTDVQ